ncbi:DUF6489 family protein [Halomonas lysinitropha]|uniref:Uncharacterized protein n=1 Tax=Halomonas lysinitropha TaxID=2607506 RepID=A0A5K1IBK4_9GAMM|nr:DUF6489 family protein [Halomonas lysinitropha]VVZ95699.1 hypothetical protein HALO32_01778 [Halomonas lysinitropha]
MKINVDFDLTPEEFRRALGLPDVEAFQKDLMNRIYKQMESGTEGYDPMSLMQPFLQQPGLSQNVSQNLSQGLSSFGNYQQMMLDMLTKAASSSSTGSGTSSNDQSDQNSESGDSGKSSSGSAGTSSTSRKSSASARSRSKRDS